MIETINTFQDLIQSDNYSHRKSAGREYSYELFFFLPVTFYVVPHSTDPQ